MSIESVKGTMFNETAMSKIIDHTGREIEREEQIYSVKEQDKHCAVIINGFRGSMEGAWH